MGRLHWNRRPVGKLSPSMPVKQIGTLPDSNQDNRGQIRTVPNPETFLCRQGGTTGEPKGTNPRIVNGPLTIFRHGKRPVPWVELERTKKQELSTYARYYGANATRQLSGPTPFLADAPRQDSNEASPLRPQPTA